MILTSRAKNGIIKTLGLFWCLVAVASVAVILFQPQPLPSPVELLVRFLFLLTIMLWVTVIAAIICRRHIEEIWGDAIAVLPFALGVAVAISWLRVWNDGSGGMALPLKQALIFIFTLGIAPMDVGPEALIRFTALALIVLLTIRLASRGVTKRRLILVSVLGWLTSAFILLLPTIMALVTGLARSYAIVNVRDALQVMALSQAGSYWHAFQAERFFAGLGKQAWTSLALSSTALAFLVTLIALILLAVRLDAWSSRNAWTALFRRLISTRVLVGASALATGLILARGIYPLIASGTDVIALIVFLAALVSYHLSVLPDRVDCLPDEVRSLLICLSLVAAWILGWPIFVLCAALFGLERLREPTTAMVGAWAGRTHVALAAAVLVLLGGAFASKGAPIPPAVFYWAAGWGVLTFLANLPSHEITLSRTRLLVIYLIGGALFAAATKLAIALPLFALLVLLSLWAHRVPGRLERYHAPAIAFFGWACLLLRIL